MVEEVIIMGVVCTKRKVLGLGKDCLVFSNRNRSTGYTYEHDYQNRVLNHRIVRVYDSTKPLQVKT